MGRKKYARLTPNQKFKEFKLKEIEFDSEKNIFIDLGKMFKFELKKQFGTLPGLNKLLRNGKKISMYNWQRAMKGNLLLRVNIYQDLANYLGIDVNFRFMLDDLIQSVPFRICDIVENTKVSEPTLRNIAYGGKINFEAYNYLMFLLELKKIKEESENAKKSRRTPKARF